MPPKQSKDEPQGEPEDEVVSGPQPFSAADHLAGSAASEAAEGDEYDHVPSNLDQTGQVDTRNLGQPDYSQVSPNFERPVSRGRVNPVEKVPFDIIPGTAGKGRVNPTRRVEVQAPANVVHTRGDGDVANFDPATVIGQETIDEAEAVAAHRDTRATDDVSTRPQGP